ncbi:MAG: Gfo/Idh/MocA family oxidoreductase [Phycisphaerae bacterium]|nr:Gfo/Idh/MocA family oxidoreductase [Phycisphaerae bacterium]
MKSTSLTAAGFAALSARSAARAAGANDRLTLAVVGCGGIAGHHLGRLFPLRETENIDFAAVCDVYTTRANQFRDRIAKETGTTPKVIGNYQDVLAMKEVDYVLFATPEHWHAKMTLDALDAGKHVYCEKPMTHTIAEAQAVVAKAKATGLKLQVGVQGMSDSRYAAANEAIRAGKLGPVIHAQIEYCRNYAANQGPWRNGEVNESTPKPEDLNWEAWLGPAPKRPWNAPRYFEWRNYRDYSGGVATDLWVHRISRILTACGLTVPTHVVSMGGIYMWPDGRDLPDNCEMVAEYPAVEGITPGMTVHVLGTMANDHAIEHCIRGHKATLVFKGPGWEIVEEGTGKVLETYEHTGGEDVGKHHQNHHAAIRKDEPLKCPPELGLHAVIPVVMANESWFQRKMMTWDAKKGQAVAS